MNVLVFEDARVEHLYPITTGRVAFAIQCGSYRLIDWLDQLGQPIAAVVRPHLRTIQMLDFPELLPQVAAEHPWTLVVNARMVPSCENGLRLRELAARTAPAIVRADWTLAAAVLPTAPLVGKDGAALLRAVETECQEREPAAEPCGLSLPLFDFPHEVVRWNVHCCGDNLRHRIEQGGYAAVRDGVFAGPGASIGDYVVTDVRNGPIVLEAGAEVGPYCFLRGPAYLGRNARAIEHSAIKDCVSIGHTAKIGGEVEASVIEAYTNKQHHGFLGHSYLGSWINLGAGTCNSDLKNTYGEVKLEYRGQKLATGMQFIGCIIGDYAKTAINTGIFTGKIIGTCSMVYGFVTTNVPSFVNYARSFGQVTELPPSVMESTQKRMFARRQVTQRPCDIQLLHDMYELTRNERHLAEEPLVF